MKEPTGNTEAELGYWQERALKAESEVRQLENDLVHLSKELRQVESMCEVYLHTNSNDDF